MKKFLTITILAVMLVVCATTTVNAVSSTTLIDDLMALGRPYGLSDTAKVKMERYLADYPVTDDEAAAIYAKAESMVAVMQNAGVSSYSELTSAQKSELKTLANEAASIVGATLVFGTNTVSVYKNGTLVDSISLASASAGADMAGSSSSDGSSSSSSASTAVTTSGTLVYTGSDYAGIIVAAVAMIALAGVALVSKRTLVNA